jgi:hypothetical protein
MTPLDEILKGLPDRLDAIDEYLGRLGATRPGDLLIEDSVSQIVAHGGQVELGRFAAERKESIRRQQAEWFADYSRSCNAPLSQAQRRDCIDQYLSRRLNTTWK